MLLNPYNAVCFSQVLCAFDYEFKAIYKGRYFPSYIIVRYLYTVIRILYIKGRSHERPTFDQRNMFSFHI